MVSAVDPSASADGASVPTVTETALALGTITLGARASRQPMRLDVTQEEAGYYYAESSTLTTNEQAADPDNRFWNYGDNDWGSGFEGSPPPPGLTYSVPDDGSGAFTLHNNSAVDVAIVNLYFPTYSSQGLVVIKSGESYKMPRASEASPLGFTAYTVQTPRTDGAPTVVGRITVSPSTLLGDTIAVGSATESPLDYIPLSGSSIPDYHAEDPDNRFVDAGDNSVFTAVTYANPVSAGVSYAVVDGRVKVFNDGTASIAITRSTPGGQILSFDVLAAGESGTYSSVPGSWQMVTVQAPKADDGSVVLLGSIMRMPAGPRSNSPAEGIPAIPLRDAPAVTNQAPTGKLLEVSRSADGRSVTFRPAVTDADHDLISYSVLTQPSRGMITHNADDTFTYTVTDRYYLHYGKVSDLFVVGASDGKGTPTGLAGQIDIDFIQVNNAPQVQVSETEDPRGALGYRTYLVTASDIDWGQYSGWIGFDQVRYSATTPSAGAVEVARPESGPTVVRYIPDLVLAHEGAYDAAFDIIVDDGQDGGSVKVPVSLHVPFYNQNPVATITSVPGSEGEFVADAEFILTLADDDFDDVSVVSLTASNGGSAVLQDGVIVYTPVGYASYGSIKYYAYSERITVVVDDGHGGRATQIQDVYVRNTEALTWLEPGQARTLIFATGSNPTAVIAAELVKNDSSIYARGYKDKVAALEADFAPELNGYNSTLQRYLVRTYAMHVVADALVTVSKSIAQIENIVRQLDAALERQGFSGVRIGTQIALEFLNGYQRTLFGQIVEITGTPAPRPSRAGEDNSGSSTPKTVPPKSTSELFKTLWDKTSKYAPIYVQEVLSDVDHDRRLIVYVAGTDFASDAQQSAAENVGASLFVPDIDVLAAIDNAISETGNPDVEILLVGYSQGGIDVINAARIKRRNVIGIVTFGSPLSTAVWSDTPSIHIRDTRDRVPKLDWGYGESLQQISGRVFEGKAETEHQWWNLVDVHTNPETYIKMGSKFDAVVTKSAMYTRMASVLRKLTGKVIRNESYGLAEGNYTWL
ncbi:hypothetical protein A5788_06690 [Gordonia sp. 852002-50816_SCH5313054-c]|nr:hypothetical protein A5785_00810 [Gordonia sp. 852002-50395_SCH5434458]OBC20332.1 hypothetical protein A5788_06690 [Gordonia sp. 852002-50816_SCH5313054-c]